MPVQTTELQQDLQRYTGRFLESLTEAMAELERSPSREVSDTALRLHLIYMSSAIDIATGPFPEVNLLDMNVFVRLSKVVLDDYWIPHVYGEPGRNVANAFARSQEELRHVSNKVMDAHQMRQLDGMIAHWRAENPNQVRVEGVRLSDFSERAGRTALADAERTKGLLSSVKSATQAADQALLLAERAMFLVHRLPFLFRLQARLAAREIVVDSGERILTGPSALLPSVIRELAGPFKRVVSRLALVGATWTVCWWVGSFVTKRLSR